MVRPMIRLSTEARNVALRRFAAIVDGGQLPAVEVCDVKLLVGVETLLAKFTVRRTVHGGEYVVIC